MAKSNQQFAQSMGQLEATLAEYFVKKAPAMPKNIKELIVKFAPYLVIISIIISVPAVFALFGLGAVVSTMPYGAAAVTGFGQWYMVGILFLIATLILEGLAVPGLLSRSRKGWNLMFYAILLNAVYAIVQMNIVGLIIGTGIGLYIAFQVRSMYR